MNTNSHNRREFIKASVIGAAGIAIGGVGFSAKSYAAIAGANERMHVAVIGARNQGTVHLASWCLLKESHNVQVRAICDTDERSCAALKLVEERSGVKPAANWDLHVILDDKEIHAVSIATPNHWHALAAVWASQAGKDVYVEKPASHNIWEGRKMIEAWRKYGRRMQVGLNNRSATNVREAIAFLHGGGIGELYMARAALPQGTRFLWHGQGWLAARHVSLRPLARPRAAAPYNEKRSHYTWHWYWDTGNGDTGNTGPHQLDIARWGMKKNEHPVAAYSTGGIFGFTQNEGKTPGTMVYGDVETYGDDKTTQETPNTQTAAYTYADGKIIELETRGRYTNHEGSAVRKSGTFFTAPRAGSKSAATPGKPFANGKSSPSRNPKKPRANAPITGRILWRRFARGTMKTCIVTSTKATSRHRSVISPTSPTASAAR